MDLPLVVRILLWPFSVIYGVYVRARSWLYRNGWFQQKHLRGKVISVGNLTLGGTGKTPMVMWLAEKFFAQGKRVAILSRGYGGSGGTSDEIELMKHRLGSQVTFGVGKDRFAEGQRIEAATPIDVFLLDDGFQHLQLARDVDILLLDGSRSVQQPLLPAGDLREPVGACSRADLIVVTRKTERRDIEAMFSHKFSIFYAQTRLLGFRRLPGDDRLHYVSEIGPGPFFAFCGIGNPQGFFDDLSHWHVPIAGKRSFRDHHRYSAKDLHDLKREALRAGAIAFVTTEKDACNISDAAEFESPIFAAAIEMAMSSESEFDATLERKLAAARGARA